MTQGVENEPRESLKGPADNQQLLFIWVWLDIEQRGYLGFGLVSRTVPFWLLFFFEPQPCESLQSDPKVLCSF